MEIILTNPLPSSKSILLAEESSDDLDIKYKKILKSWCWNFDFRGYKIAFLACRYDVLEIFSDIKKLFIFHELEILWT